MEQHETLERVAPVCFSLYHLHDFFVNGLSGLVSITPVVPCTDATFADVKVLWVIDVLVRAILYAIDDSRFEVYQYGSGDISRVVTLIVEDVLTIAALCREVFEVPVLIDTVLLAELLPELTADFYM